MSALGANVRAFFLRGNVAGLTVAVAVGFAFVTFVQTLVDGLVLPLVVAIFSDVPSEALSFAIGDDGSEVYYGYVIGAFVAFAVVAATAYLLVMLPVNRYVARRRAADEAEATAA
jgi:large conductance mechanosensitive channel